MTLTLEAALADLPAKPRVHELSKRVGTTSKEMLAVLGERGLTITSASASVPREVAIAIIEQYLGEPPVEVLPPPHDEPAEAPAGETAEAPAGETVESPTGEPAEAPAGESAERSAGGPPTEEPAGPASADLLSPLFLPPTEAAPAPVEGVEPAPGEPAGEEEPPKRSRRRRGRSRRYEPADTVADGGSDAVEPIEVAPVETPADEVPEEAGEEPESDDQAEGAGRRRRRRGRRGRGRVTDTDEQPDTDDDEAVPSATEPEGENGPAGDGADEADEAAETEDAEDEGPSSGNRRRRRRRRRSSADTSDEAGPREDDPDNTVVHVRDPRGTSANEVQGVRGSTRLEAKRQRRRDSRESSRRRPQILTEAEFLARRESVERVMAVRQRGDLAQVALLEDGILVEHFVSQTGADSLIGSVFLGKVQNVLPSMEAAFVDIGRGRNAVIYAGEVNWAAAGLGGKARRIESALTSGDTILAQVSKDPVGHKGARLTTQISLPGRFLVYVPGGGATGISRKLPDTERKRLKAILDRIVPEDAGVIIRTAAEGVPEEELARDVERLKSQWEEISRKAQAKGSAPTPLYAEPGTLIKVVRDLFNSDITRLVVDGDKDVDTAWGPVSEYVNAVAPELADRLVRWDNDGQDVFANYRIDEQIAKALERKVHLPSGGSLIIDRTEAMTVVDVNTGKYTGSGGNLEETVTKNNLEAAEEIVRQLRLRDIGGIIVIDFIDMVLESNRELVLRRLTEALGRDRTRHQVAEVTSLGLVQMTRKRMGTGLVEAFSEPCPHCGGRGIVLHELPVATAPEQAPVTERRGKGRRRGRDGGRADEIVIPRVETTLGRRPDPRGPKPPAALVAHPEDEPVDVLDVAVEIGVEPGVEPVDEAADEVADAAESELVLAIAEEAAQAAESADEAGEPVVEPPTETVEPAVPAVPVAEVVATVPVIEPVIEPEPEPAPPPVTDGPPRRRRAAGRPAGSPAAAAAVDIVLAESSGNGGPSGSSPPDRPTGGYLVSDDGQAPTRPPRRAASRPAGPSTGDGEPVVVTVAERD